MYIDVYVYIDIYILGFSFQEGLGFEGLWAWLKGFGFRVILEPPPQISAPWCLDFPFIERGFCMFREVLEKGC